MSKKSNPTKRSATVVCRAESRDQYPQKKISALAIFIFAVLNPLPVLAVFTPEVVDDVVTGELLNTGDIQNIGMGGIAEETTINGTLSSGGKQYVNEGGTANNTTMNGGKQYVNEGGTTNSTTLNNGAQYVNEGGIANNTIMNDGNQYVYAGGIANGTTINSMTQYVYGTANDTTMNGGNQYVYGTANNTNISGGSQYIYDGGIDNDTIINGGDQRIRVGGVANNAIVNGGLQIVYEGGIANSTAINNGTQQVNTGGIANNTKVNGGYHYVFGGTANDTMMSNSGFQSIGSGGVTNNTTINDNGYQSVGSILPGSITGTANNTTINNNGIQAIQKGGLANNTIINGNGEQIVEGIASGTTIHDNGLLDVITEGRLAGQIIVNDLGTIRSRSIYGVVNDGPVQNEGELIFQRSADYLMKFNLAGTGSLTQNGPYALTLAVASSYTGATNVNHGTLKAGANNVFSASSDYITQVGGALDLDGYHQTLQSLNNSGTVNFGGIGGNTLTITGDYTGNNGLLNMNSVLEDDGSVTDKLIIVGNTAGNTFVQVNNLGGSGAQTLNGIELITVGGVSDGEFTQQGRIVAGAYDYYLERGVGSNNANWYLNSSIPMSVPGPSAPEVPVPPITERPETPPPMIERPEAGGYSANLAAANNLFVTRLHDRLGETHYIDALTGEQKVTSLWLRNEGGHNRSRDSQDQLRTQSNRYVMQLGGDIAQWS
uniref:autotransporter outer membrane beta-barrel domain-containing protein n=2 Tax=Yersinia frederiksenii TaxID=29484 RepID=UPI000AAF9A82